MDRSRATTRGTRDVGTAAPLPPLAHPYMAEEVSDYQRRPPDAVLNRAFGATFRGEMPMIDMFVRSNGECRAHRTARRSRDQ
jgi:hypothetical protein